MVVQQRSSGVSMCLRGLVDSYIISPRTREQYWYKASNFAQEQPLLFTFALAQLLFSFLPLALFTSFVLGTLVLSLVTALLFSLFWIGVALLVLIPTLFVTVSLGFICWVWVISSFLVLKWVYDKLPVSAKGSTEVALPNGKKFVVDKSAIDGDFNAEVKNGV